MAVTNIINKATYACDGTTKTFDLAVKVFALSDVVVSVKRLSTGAVTTLVVDVDYTVTSISGSLENGVRITTLPATAYSNDYTITLLRTIATTQNLELEVGGDLPANELEDALDRGVMISQQITERSNRSLQFPVTDPTGTTYTAGTTEERANKACGYDANGNVTELDLAAAGAVAVDTNKGLSLASNIISAKVDDSTLEFGTLGIFQVKDIGITTGKLANGAVTLAKVASAALSGADATLITGTKGTTNSTAKWNADGDLVDGYPVLDEDNMASDSATSLATQQSIKAYVDTSKTSAFVPTAYAGEGSVTLPNGLIMKWGTIQANGNTGATITFSDAFPSNCINVTATMYGTAWPNTYGLVVKSISASNTVIMSSSDWTGAGENIMWQAIGY